MPGHKKGAIYKMLGYQDILENLLESAQDAKDNCPVSAITIN